MKIPLNEVRAWKTSDIVEQYDLLMFYKEDIEAEQNEGM